MTQEEKDLLLKALCEGLPYGLIVHSLGTPHEQKLIGYIPDIEHYCIEPYLRPMSSMTEEEKMEYRNITPGIEWNYGIQFPTTNKMDWLNAHHFDYRGLIEKGLALEAKEGMYEEKKA